MRIASSSSRTSLSQPIQPRLSNHSTTFQSRLLAELQVQRQGAYARSSIMPAIDLKDLPELRSVQSNISSEMASGSLEAHGIVIAPTDTTEVKLEKLQQMAALSDYTGMEYGEIYTTIWNRYDRAFDGQLSAILSLAGPGPSSWSYIFNQFMEETGDAVITPLFQDFVDQGILEEGEVFDEKNTYVMQCLSDIKSAPLGYSGMSFEEKELAILEKYQGKLSYLDFLSMQGELKNTMVYQNKMGRDGASDFLSTLDSQLAYNYVYKNDIIEPSQLCHNNPQILFSDAQWDQIFQEEFDIHRFINTVRESQGTAIFLQDPAFHVLAVVAAQVDGFMDLLDRHDRR